ncbi:FecR family protein [Mucilaginibacter terrenus]|uniref:FecR family protein n=1 Tax=Mucilaginibacter terrenus TaxID=2482727 RepID=A0A3E2NPW7_9SPHI|nr:FecR family protein [Mucilaginibacter terrenus]RFZ83038.1 FecR family protein [Mucilaginibacter terrenus]
MITLDDQQMVNERFTELLTKKLTDELDESELKEFHQFLAESQVNKEQYKFFKSYWVQDQEQYSNSDLMFQRIKSKITLPEQAADEIVEEPTGRNVLAMWIRVVAAAFIVAVGGGLLYYMMDRGPGNDYATLQLTETPTRVKSKLVLSDGSEVTLNSQTELRYPAEFKGKTREVFLSGEAFFDVKKDAQHPFIVHAGNMSIKVLGTAFNIRSYKNDAASETTLIRGAIEVTLTDRPNDRIILKPNEKLVLKSTPLTKVAHKKHKVSVNPDSVNTSYALTSLTYLRANDSTVVETSWVNNKLVFKDKEFSGIATQMERWYGIKIKFKNDDAKDYHFTGVFEKETVFQALKALQMIEPFTYKQKNNTIYIY